MLKVIQVKIQEYTAAKRRVQKLPGSIDRTTGSTNQNTYLQNSISAQTLLKCIGFQLKHY